MRFWDSSAVVPLLLEGPRFSWARERQNEDPAMVVWWATPVECVSAIARWERGGSLTPEQVNTALRRLEKTCEGWTEIQPSPSIREAGKRIVRVHPLRAADALQLAAALVASDMIPSALPFVCLDDRLRLAAGREGFPLAT